jgi:hypothetical protein
VAELHGARDAECCETAEVGRVEALRVLDPVTEPERLPEVARRLERVERLAVRAVADRVHRDGPACGCSCADDLRQLLAARDHDAAPVEHPRGLRAEGAVHERLQVPEPQVVVTEPGADAQRRELPDAVVRERLPDTQGQAVVLVDAGKDRVCAEPAVLVVDRADTSRVRELDPFARGGDPLVLGDRDVAVAEAPRRLLTEDPGRRSGVVSLDDAAGHLEVAVRACEPGAVEPQRVVVLRPERRGYLAGHLVERLARRMLCPEGVPPARPPQPRSLARMRGDPGERIRERGRTLEPDVPAARATTWGSARGRP